MAIYTVNISSAGSSDVVSLTDGSTYATLEVSAGKGPKGDGWTGVSYDTNTGRFTFTSNDGLGYVSDDITADLDAAVAAAQAAQSGAEGAEAATEALFDQFGDQYLGPKASDPTVDNDGDPLTAGDIYFNTTDSVLKFYSGAAWVAPESIATTAASDAQAAQAAAETAETNAETAQTAAETAEANAAASETAAAGSAAAASTSADEAAASAASINLNSIDINGGTIDGTVIGGTTPAAGNFTTGSFTGDVSFGDNDKAIFGAGSDLQIYHDGGNSYIYEGGTGSLKIQAVNLNLQSTTGESYIDAVNNGSVYIYYDNAAKLATTSTGVDVTGTLTSDGLTVDGGASVAGISTLASGTNGEMQLGLGTALVTGAGTYDSAVRANGGGSLLLSTGATKRFEINTIGDISFYEDTGTTPKFFWDASAERLGIGTSSPNYNLTSYKVGANANYIQVTNGSTGPNAANGTLFGVDASGNGVVTVQGSFDYITSVAGSEAMRISSSGFVGINETSPATELDVNGTTTSNQYLLDNIAKDITDTAVDVFVYDTSKDSDGGAWRKRTQGTSWYNETLNTATRGSRKEFPAVAVIVAESNQVTIYDGDDPDLPMWMVFNGSSSNLLYLPALSLTSVTALNGIIGVGKISHQFTTLEFISDTARIIATDGIRNFSGASISQRNDSVGIGSPISSTSIVNSTINDVAMTVLPNAPIDAATGLPVPTIAVATNGGTSVIRDDGSVVDIKYASYTASRFVSFTAKNYLVCNFDNVTTNGRFTKVYRTIPSSDQSSAGTPYNSTNGEDAAYSNDLNASWQGDLKFSEGLPANRQFDNFSFAHSKGLLLLDENEEAPSKGMLADITSTYNTGWMNGDIKLATLSDTDDTDVTGSELVTNGTFDSDTTGWTVAGSGASAAVSSGQLVLTRAGNSSNITQYITTVVGQAYTLSFDFTAASGGANMYATLSGLSTITATATTGSYSITAVATSTSTYVQFQIWNATNGTITLDNVSVRLAEEDRSVNGNGLQVFGSITKNPVASGADLVAYSGFSNSNYLMQPYNSDLDFAAEFFYNVWAYKPSDASENSIISRGQNGSTNGFFFLGTNISGQVYSYVGPSLINTSITVASGVWNMYSVARSSGKISFYLNGKQIYSISNTNSLSNTVAKLYVGTSSYVQTIPYTGSVALARASATAPSPEQIAKIYEDEKVLFQENAQATLYGDSDAVTALAYDDTTELLHVGTSAGRSVFQGLRRVDNTTDAVGAAISASGGLVADE
jgi:hypothetical protein